MDAMQKVERNQLWDVLRGGEWCRARVVNVLSDRVNLFFTGHDAKKGNAVMVTLGEMKSSLTGPGRWKLESGRDRGGASKSSRGDGRAGRIARTAGQRRRRADVRHSPHRAAAERLQRYCLRPSSLAKIGETP
jgi:hypothetical protein